MDVDEAGHLLKGLGSDGFLESGGSCVGCYIILKPKHPLLRVKSGSCEAVKYILTLKTE